MRDFFHQQYVGGGDLLVHKRIKNMMFFLLLGKNKANKHDPEMFQRANNAARRICCYQNISSIVIRKQDQIISTVSNYKYLFQKSLASPSACVLYNHYSNLNVPLILAFWASFVLPTPNPRDLAPKQNAWSSRVPHLLPDKRTKMETTTTTGRRTWWMDFVDFVDWLFLHQTKWSLMLQSLTAGKKTPRH